MYACKMSERGSGFEKFDFMQLNDLLYGKMMGDIKYVKIKHENFAI